MKIKNFIKKYKIIILLVFLIFVLIFTKIYFNQNSLDKEKNQSEIKTNITPTVRVKGPISSLDDQQKQQLSNQLTEEYYDIKDEEQAQKFLENLTDEERFLIQEIDPNYEFEPILPYETNTFIINEYIKANTLSATAKGNNFQKSVDNLQKWLAENTEDPSKITIVWEN